MHLEIRSLVSLCRSVQTGCKIESTLAILVVFAHTHARTTSCEYRGVRGLITGALTMGIRPHAHCQVTYDDPDTLAIKYKAAFDAGGWHWHVDC